MARPHRLPSAALHYDNTAAEAVLCLIFHPFYTLAKLEDHVSWNISQTCDSFTEKKISIQMCEPQLWRRRSHSEYEVLVFLFRLCIRPDATHLRPHASHDPAPVYRGQNPSPSCKQADKDNLIDVGAAQR